MVAVTRTTPTPSGYVPRVHTTRSIEVLKMVESVHPERRFNILAALGLWERVVAEAYLQLHPERRTQFLRQVSPRPPTPGPADGV